MSPGTCKNLARANSSEIVKFKIIDPNDVYPLLWTSKAYKKYVFNIIYFLFWCHICTVLYLNISFPFISLSSYKPSWKLRANRVNWPICNQQVLSFREWVLTAYKSDLSQCIGSPLKFEKQVTDSLVIPEQYVLTKAQKANGDQCAMARPGEGFRVGAMLTRSHYHVIQCVPGTEYKNLGFQLS